MTTEHKIVLALMLVIGIGAALSTYLVMDARLRSAVAEQHSRDVQDRIDEISASMAKRQSEFEDWKASFEKMTKQVKTSSEVATAASRPADQGGLIFNPFRPVTTTDPESGKPETRAIVPDENIVPLYQNLRNCDARAKELGKCEVDNKDLTAKLDLMTQDRDQWRETARGGSKLSRTWSALKVGGCAAGGATPGIAIKDPKATAIGAGIGAAFCALVLRH